MVAGAIESGVVDETASVRESPAGSGIGDLRKVLGQYIEGLPPADTDGVPRITDLRELLPLL